MKYFNKKLEFALMENIWDTDDALPDEDEFSAEGGLQFTRTEERLEQVEAPEIRTWESSNRRRGVWRDAKGKRWTPDASVYLSDGQYGYVDCEVNHYRGYPQTRYEPGEDPHSVLHVHKSWLYNGTVIEFVDQEAAEEAIWEKLPRRMTESPHTSDYHRRNWGY
jgi:hypothetical protein